MIVECGFLSNAKEARRLEEDKYQDRLAWSLHMGIMEYLNGSLLACSQIVVKSTGYKKREALKNQGFPANKKSARRDSNPRPPPWQGGAPPLSHSRL